MIRAGAPGATPPGAIAGGAAPLRLRAEDEEDLAVISACLQDALVAVGDLAYDPGARVFLLIANRFRWEDCRSGTGDCGPFARTLCAVTFDNIAAAAYRGFPRGEKDRILCLLAIRPVADTTADTAAGAEPGLTLSLDFAGNAEIRLTASALRVRARDFGDPWQTKRQPGHELNEEM
jgi:hypothetical protein